MVGGSTAASASVSASPIESMGRVSAAARPHPRARVRVSAVSAAARSHPRARVRASAGARIGGSTALSDTRGIERAAGDARRLRARPAARPIGRHPRRGASARRRGAAGWISRCHWRRSAAMPHRPRSGNPGLETAAVRPADRQDFVLRTGPTPPLQSGTARPRLDLMPWALCHGPAGPYATGAAPTPRQCRAGAATEGGDGNKTGRAAEPAAKLRDKRI